jgi:hypothetical protein
MGTEVRFEKGLFFNSSPPLGGEAGRGGYAPSLPSPNLSH